MHCDDIRVKIVNKKLEMFIPVVPAILTRN